jgi:hypothetical protein
MKIIVATNAYRSGGNHENHTHHPYDVLVDGFREDAPAGRDVVDDLIECGALDLLPL